MIGFVIFLVMLKNLGWKIVLRSVRESYIYFVHIKVRKKVLIKANEAKLAATKKGVNNHEGHINHSQMPLVVQLYMMDEAKLKSHYLLV